MKLPVLLFLALAGSLQAAATAYQALEYYDRNASLENIYMVRGEGGSPHPSAWVLYRGKQNAPTFDMAEIKSSGVILTGKIPVSTLGLAPHAQRLNFTVLNLDSNAAWHIAKREARKEAFKFDRIDYELKMNPIAGVPAWTMRLFNERLRTVGELTVSGATGDVLHPIKLFRYAVEDENGNAVVVTSREPWVNRALRSVGRWFSQTGTTFGKDMLRATGTAEEIIVGGRTRPYAEDVE